METIRRLRGDYTAEGLLRLYYEVYGTECGIKPTARYLPVEYESALDTNLSGLSAREKRLMEMRFGLKGDRSYSLEEISKILPVAYSRAAKIEHTVISKVRISGFGPLLEAMLEFPATYELEREAGFRNYIRCEQDAPAPYDAMEFHGLNAFGKLCWLSLRMYQPFEGPLGEDAKKVTIADANFSVRTYMYLVRFGIETLKDLTSLTESDFKRNITAKPQVLSEVKQKLEKYHLGFAQQV